MQHATVAWSMKGRNHLRFRDFHKNVKTRIYVLFVVGMVQAMTFPYMAVYFAKNFGETATGVLLTMGVAANIVSGAFGGYYADRIGRKKLMVLAEVLYVASYLAMTIANSPWFDSPILTFVAFFVTNICWGIYGPADEAMLLDVTDANSRQLMYSIFYWVHNLTMAIGASIGALFFEHHRFVLFGMMTVAVFGSLMTTIFLISETYFPNVVDRDKAVHPVKGVAQNYIAVFKDRIFLLYLAAGVLLMTIEFQLSNYIGIRLAKDIAEQPLFPVAGFSLQIDGFKMLGFLQTENTVLVVLLAGIAVKLSQRHQDKQVLFFGILLYTVGYSIITVSSAPMLLLAAMLIATVGEVTSVPVRQSYLGDIAPVEARSSYVAVNGMTFGGARILASLGVILGAYASPFTMGMISVVLGAVSYFLYQSIVPDVHARRKQTATATVEA